MDEAPVVMFTNYKRTDGFEVCVTLRGVALFDVAKDFTAAVEKIKDAGGTPLPLRSSGGGFPKKEKEYIEGRVCPTDGGRLVKPSKENQPIKCENNRYDYTTKTSSGCQYIEWPKSGYEKDMENVGNYGTEGIEATKEDNVNF